ncbi:GH92 family glycosyl hydrolase [Aureisphaera galaxeae]|uniref:GH92 family glycosyl hydrolase n=1 Tax=Aureisphaera galaxeae TaxID=1538023 RepID=UPI0023508B11|nr:GH92 family glycosyl hydrolase [Aureisphaera galaxeae]MDC8005890.1 GH92 family glycosyl hydrolase [Aureisphaera galaxeae]
MLRNILIFTLLLALIGCNKKQSDPQPAQKDKALTSYVNTFIGTGGHGHTYPGATMPFGMMQLSPDTRLEGWDGCSGYHYSDSYIYGFSHTHLSGTGVSDYGDLLLMPTLEPELNNGADGKKGYRAHFKHEEEFASPGFYKVHLDSTNIHVELTVTKRAGMHRYEYPNASDQYLILDIEHRDKLLDGKIERISDTEISGYRFSKAWATDQRVFFYIRFSHPLIGDLGASHPLPYQKKAAFLFNNPNNEPVYISVGISAVDEEGAKKNLEEEIGSKSFEQLKQEANDAWEKQLEKIVIESDDEDYKTNFYTSLYHTMIAPNLYQDVDGRYRGMDLEVHETNAFDYYTVFSLWDTYRAAHPLYTIIEQDRTNDFVNTMLAKYDEGGIMPIWDLSANYTGCMIGYHGVPVIADAYLKGIQGYDTQKALEAMKHSATRDHLGLESYKTTGFIPVEEESESVSKTLEYAYDDWTISEMAKAMGDTETAKAYAQRGQYYKNLYNPETGFLQGRFRNTWFGPFDPFEVNFNYTEANAWQYSLYAPQDISGLMELMGGKDKLESHLDQLFTAKSETSGRDQADITGLIGQYAHGNEPSHHMAYLYNFVNKPHKTQEKVHQILTELYTNTPDGISGNEDCGQMSAWYIFSSLGFYPVTPGSNQYIIGTPLFPKSSIHTENGKTFTIEAKGISETNKYIASVQLNGEPLNRSYLFHKEIMDGGHLVFEMTGEPSTWGTMDEEVPVTEIADGKITLAPFISSGDVAFKNETEISLKSLSEGATVYYNIDGSEFQEYKGPFTISEKCQLSTYAEKDGNRSSTLTTEFYKIDPNVSITLETEYANQYSAGGNDALIDGIKGAKDFRTGAWQGYSDTDVIAIVDLGSIKPIETIEVSFLQDQRSWIFYPTEVECFVAPGKTFYKSLPKQVIDAETPSENSEIKTVQFNMNGYSSRYIKIVAKNLGDLPEWHLGHPYNGKAWIFVDEITVR